MKPTLVLIAIASLVALSACRNIADSTTAATVQEAVAVVGAAGGEVFEFVEGSTISFVGSKFTGSHEGGFKAFTGHFLVQNGEPTGGEATIQMDSTWSDAAALTAHLKAPDFFDVETYPEATFKVTSFTKKGGAHYDLSGNLTLHGVTRNMTFPTQVTRLADTLTLQAEFDINRQDFGIAYQSRKDDLIRDEVIIRLHIEAKPKA